MTELLLHHGLTAAFALNGFGQRQDGHYPEALADQLNETKHSMFFAYISWMVNARFIELKSRHHVKYQFIVEFNGDYTYPHN
ncbi:hypothetical protein [Bosea sp. LC85]|uniref:hypothetical protein n=1 Tax=Bosea sp. LC85 TaxID=1502851 RepID=UPI00126A3301|nr:hypothetical protein [Bosea sp. LC85]